MKNMTCRLLVAVFAIGLGADLLASENIEPARISLAGTGGRNSKIITEDYIVLVVEGASLSYDGNPIPNTEAIDYVNKLLEVKNVSHIGVYAREGARYGDVVHALDLLRTTKAKNIGLSMNELPLGRQI